VDCGLTAAVLEGRYNSRFAFQGEVIGGAVGLSMTEARMWIRAGVRASLGGHAITMRFDSSSGYLAAWSGEIDELTMSVALAVPQTNVRAPRVNITLMATD
jgi:hypothetical protein